jgi:regulator of protease activity HflC (stomatin/prohibitin superfamily)
MSMKKMKNQNKKDNKMESNINVKGIIIGVATAVIGLIILFTLGDLFEKVDAGEHVVIQSLGVTGNSTLNWYSDPGYKLQAFGKPTHYQRSFQYWFSASPDQGSNQDQSIPIVFNDGGKGWISGSVRVDLPVDPSTLTEMHVRYGGLISVEQQLIRTVIEKAVYMSGPMMSSKESYAERKNELISLIEDQAANGVYKTEVVNQEVIDPVSGEKKKAAVVKVLKDSNGQPIRHEQSPLIQFKIRLYNLSINSIKYSDTIQEQINSQQKAIMDVQTAKANAQKAQQQAITVAAEGEATAAKAKWEQEAKNATSVSEAEGKMKRAEADKKAAEYEKAAMILRGEGEAEARKLVMSADGALDKKLATYERVMAHFAEALKDSKQPIVPNMIVGHGGTGTSSANDFLQLIAVKAAKDLSLDLSAQKK